jgi:membrane protein DedA with SNARE-associated domain
VTPLASLTHSMGSSIESLIAGHCYLGVFLAMLIENFLQFIPSEAIMPLAGFFVAQGKLQMVPTIAAGTLGTILGTLPWYLIGRTVNEERIEHHVERHGAWLGITTGKLRKSRHWFNRHGHHIVFWGRLVPILRTLVSIPAGIELMPLRSFLIWTSLGSLLWNLFLTVVGYTLGQNWAALHAFLRPFTLLAAGGLLGFTIWFLFFLGRGKQAGS